MTTRPRMVASSDVVRTLASHGSGRRPLHDWMLNFLIAGIALAVALGLGELAVRFLAPQQLILLKRPDVWQAADTLGWVHRPGISTTINSGERTVRLLTDRDGFRVGRASASNARKRILLLGDSFMEALQVEYEESFAGLLEARLSQRLKEPVAVRNTAVAGWNPNQYLMEAQRVLHRERFDLVLVFVYLGNDVVRQRVARYPPRAAREVHPLRLPRRLMYREFIDAVLYPINDFLEVRSHLFVFFKTRLEVLLMRLGLTAMYFPDGLLHEEAGSPRWAVTAQILSDVRDVARTHGARTLFVLTPDLYQVDGVEFHRALKGFRIDPAAVDLTQPNRLLTAAMNAHHLDVCDVLSDFRRAVRGGARLYGKVDTHLNPAGHELLERWLEPLVVAHLTASRRGTPQPR
jgi:lysophospholipase L1-like esterase